MYANGKGMLRNYIIAYMWSNIAAANGVEHGANVRDAVARNLTQADLAKAQELSRSYLAKEYHDCGF